MKKLFFVSLSLLTLNAGATRIVTAHANCNLDSSGTLTCTHLGRTHTYKNCTFNSTPGAEYYGMYRCQGGVVVNNKGIVQTANKQTDSSTK